MGLLEAISQNYIQCFHPIDIRLNSTLIYKLKGVNLNYDITGILNLIFR